MVTDYNLSNKINIKIMVVMVAPIGGGKRATVSLLPSPGPIAK